MFFSENMKRDVQLLAVIRVRILLYVCPHSNACGVQLLAYLAVIQPD